MALGPRICLSTFCLRQQQRQKVKKLRKKFREHRRNETLQKEEQVENENKEMCRWCCEGGGAIRKKTVKDISVIYVQI